MEKINTVLFVCTGNTCRSPMAQVIFESLALKNKLACKSLSAGIAVGSEGRNASEEAVAAVKRMGLDLSEHKNKSIRSLDLDSVDLFVAMTADHAGVLINLGIPKSKIYVMDIPDPFGGSQQVYDECCEMIKKSVEHLIVLIKENNEC